MHHLNLEALARLVDEPPLDDEAGHLRDCLVCRRELDAMREQTVLLAELPPLEPAPAAWSGLERRLLEEGLMRTPATPAPARRTPLTWLRLAASLALFLSGAAGGAMAWRRWAEPPRDPIAELPTRRAIPPSPAGEDAAGTLASAEQTIPEAAPVQGARLVSGGPAPTRAAPPAPARSAAVRRAERELQDAESAYLAALRRYAELADPASGADPATRLEALDRLVEMSARALDRAPDDPQLNGYHLAALEERDALRRQMQQAAETTWF